MNSGTTGVGNHNADTLSTQPNQLSAPSQQTTADTQTPSTTEPETTSAPKNIDLNTVSNEDFINAVFNHLPEGSSPLICSKKCDPSEGGWTALPADFGMESLTHNANNYLSCSSFLPDDTGSFSAKKENVSAYHFIMLDDLGTKIPLERLGNFPLSWLIETSPGNHQGGIILSEPLTDLAAAGLLQDAVIAAGLCDGGASGLTRWARLPNAINGKEKHRDEEGNPFQCRLVEWNPDYRYTPDKIIIGLNLVIQPERLSAGSTSRSQLPVANAVYTPRPVENPVLTKLKELGLYKGALGAGKHDITCPWVDQHTDALDTGTAYFEPDNSYPTGGFCCQHSHRDQYHISQLLEFLDISPGEARHQSVIRIIPGELNQIVDAAERLIAERGNFYQAGGLIVSVLTDPTTGDPSIAPTNLPALTKELAGCAVWEKYDGRSGGWIRCDPPPRHVSILHDSKVYAHLPPLAGLARQPYFRSTDGELVMESGYDPVSKLFAVFDPGQFALPEPTLEAAQVALSLLEELLSEFHFVSPTDKAAALSAIFTAVVRPTLDFAPAYHVKAPVFGSGKTYLCELIGSFAGPAPNAKVSYPTTSEEATKAMLSLLLTNPAVIEFDDMDTDWIPHGAIKRMLTAEHISDRILGVSKTATVSTKSLFLGSGNNVGPVRDLLRRIVTVNVDPRCATPATLIYSGAPVAKVRRERGRYVSAVLTIIQAWRKAGCPRADHESIVTYNGAWSDYCRHPLMWLGHPDPATSLLEQVKHDPDAENLGRLMKEWYRLFGSTPTTLRKALELDGFDSDLYDAIREFPVEERGVINRSKLGWLLKKNANRVIDGYELQKVEAGDRTAWRVVRVEVPASPALPPFSGPVHENVDEDDPF